jgi:MFS family permease
MKTTRRRYWVFFLLFLFNLIAYVDRVNMSVAGKPIAQEFGLSPVALGYLFSSFLWAYVLMMLPGGRLIDRWGAHVMASIATAVWSAAQMATGAASSFANRQRRCEDGIIRLASGRRDENCLDHRTSSDRSKPVRR